jgi:hypothetical protein
MFCPKCGKENAAGAAFCSQCGASLNVGLPRPATPGWSPGPSVPVPGAAPAYVPNYLAQAILVTLFCCLPLGIVSIVFASQVNGKLAAGDVAGAQQASKNARTWAWVSFGLGLAIGLLYAAGMVVAGVMSHA